MRTALTLISAIYVLRGAALIPALTVPALNTPFNIWSSLIVLIYALCYAVGTWKAWPSLSQRKMVDALDA